LTTFILPSVLAGPSIGQLRWLSTSRSSSADQQQQQQQNPQQQQLDEKELMAAAQAATAPDTFKRGDALAGGRCVS
jgi:hypothetical protein